MFLYNIHLALFYENYFKVDKLFWTNKTDICGITLLILLFDGISN
jgi:hypothetical protein